LRSGLRAIYRSCGGSKTDKQERVYIKMGGSGAYNSIPSARRRTRGRKYARHEQDNKEEKKGRDSAREGELSE
jgi:hypothetical protein